MNDVRYFPRVIAPNHKLLICMDMYLTATGFTLEQICERNIHPDMVEARAKLIVFLHMNGISWPAIGRAIDRDKTSVKRAYKSYKARQK